MEKMKATYQKNSRMQTKQWLEENIRVLKFSYEKRRKFSNQWANFPL